MKEYFVTIGWRYSWATCGFDHGQVGIRSGLNTKTDPAYMGPMNFNPEHRLPKYIEANLFKMCFTLFSGCLKGYTFSKFAH